MTEPETPTPVHGVACQTPEEVLAVLARGELTSSECARCGSLLFESEFPAGVCGECEAATTTDETCPTCGALNTGQGGWCGYCPEGYES